MTRRARAAGVSGLLVAAFTAGGCTTTTIDWRNLAAGQEIVLQVKSPRSPLRVVNHGPGAALVTSDCEGLDLDRCETLGPGCTDVPLRGWTTLTVANPNDDGPDGASLRLEIKDPARFTLDQRPITPPPVTHTPPVNPPVPGGAR